MNGSLRDDEDAVGKIAFLLVVGPFFVAFALRGFSFATISARLLFDVLSCGGSLPSPVEVRSR